MTHKTWLTTALLAAMFAAPVALAQQAGVDIAAEAEAAAHAHASAPTERLAERYAGLVGSTGAATELVERLHAGGADVAAMGYGEIDIALAMAEALVEAGAVGSADAALDQVLQHRADGLGYGEIPRQLDLDPGSLTGSAPGIGLDAGTAAGAALSAVTDASAGRIGGAVDTAVDAAGSGNADVAIANDVAVGRIDTDVGAATTAGTRVPLTPGQDTAADTRANARIGVGVRGGASGLPVGTGQPLLPTRPLLPERPLRGIR